MSINVSARSAEFGFETAAQGSPTLITTSWRPFNGTQTGIADTANATYQWQINSGIWPYAAITISAFPAIATSYASADISAFQLSATQARPGTIAFYNWTFQVSGATAYPLVNVEFELVYTHNFYETFFSVQPKLQVFTSAHFGEQIDTFDLSKNTFDLSALCSTHPVSFTTAVGTFVSIIRTLSTHGITTAAMTFADVTSVGLGLFYVRGEVSSLPIVGLGVQDAGLIDRVQGRYTYAIPTADRAVQISQQYQFSIGNSSPEFGFELLSVSLPRLFSIGNSSPEFGFETTQISLTQKNKINFNNPGFTPEFGFEITTIPLTNNSLTTDVKSSEYGYETRSVALSDVGIISHSLEFGFEMTQTPLLQDYIFTSQNINSEYGFESNQVSVAKIVSQDVFSSEYGFESSSLILRTFVNRPETINPYVNFPLERVIYVDSFPRTRVVKPGERITEPDGQFRTRIVGQIADRRIIALPTG